MSHIRPLDANHGAGPVPRAVPGGPALEPTPLQGAGARATDGVDLSPSGRRDRLLALNSQISAVERRNIEALKADDALADLDGLLRELSAVADEAARVGAGDQAALRLAQGRIDALTDSVLDAADKAGSSLAGRLRQRGTGVTDVSDQVVVGEARARLRPGERLDITVQVTASAQTAGYLLSFGGGTINLGGAGSSDGTSSRFVIQVGGNKGGRELAFASGTSMSDIAAAINAFSSATGVKARASGTAVRIDSAGYGSDQFVSVRTNDSGAINASAANAGLYGLEEGDASRASTDPARRVLWSAASNTQTDHGKDVQALVNGGHAEGKGTRVRALSLQFFVDFNLLTGPVDPGEANATHPGSFKAFTLVGLPLPRGIDDLRTGGALAPTPQNGASEAQAFIDGASGEVRDRRESLLAERRGLAAQIALLQQEISRAVSGRVESGDRSSPADAGAEIIAQTGGLTPDRVAALLRTRLNGAG
ncbi:MAG TPA: hypothetical protein DEB06_10745 [Phycisphaerales bacterium]|nr:hypothetical protein [Phycisphaerales bacterium]